MINLRIATAINSSATCRAFSCSKGWPKLVHFTSVLALAIAMTSGTASADDGQSGAGATHGTGSPIEGGMDWGTLDTIEVVGSHWAPEILSIDTFNDMFLNDNMFFEENQGDLAPNFGLDADSTKPPCSNPIIPSTGAKMEHELDFASLELEMPLSLSRTYNNNMIGQSRGYPLFGTEWSSNFDYWMYGEQDENGIAYLFLARPEGKFIKFIHAGGNRYNEDKPGSIAYVLVSNPDNYTWAATHYTEDNKVEQFKNGYIQSIRNEHGIGWDFSWAPFQYGSSNQFTRQRLQRVTHASGRYVEFSYNGSNGQVVTSVRDPAGHVFQYLYGSLVLNGQAYYYDQKVVRPDGATTTYHFQWMWGPLLLGKSINDVRYSTFTYNNVVNSSAHRSFAYSSEHAGGIGRSTFDYTPSADLKKITKVVETNPLGKKTITTFNDKGDVTSVVGEASPHCTSSFSSLTYDANGYKDVAVSFSGVKTDFDYDSGGHLLKKVEAVGTSVARVSTYAWDLSHNRLVRMDIAGAKREEYIYGSDNRLAMIRTTNLSSNGEVNKSHSTNYSYTKHPNGLLNTITIDGPIDGVSDALHYSYDNLGNLITKRNSLNQTVSYSNYNGLGQPGRVTDANGSIVEYEYDVRGHVVVERTFPNGSPVEIRYVYGASSLLDAVTTTDGNTTYYHYDAARRLIQEDLTEPGGSLAVKRYTYDAMSNPIKIEVGRDL